MGSLLLDTGVGSSLCTLTTGLKPDWLLGVALEDEAVSSEQGFVITASVWHGRFASGSTLIFSFCEFSSKLL